MKIFPVPVIIAGMMLPVVVSAQPEPKPKPGESPERRAMERGRGGSKGGPLGGGWKQADKDGDGKLSREEFDRLPRIEKLPEEKRDRIFKRLDKDGDGILSGEELEFSGPSASHPRGPLFKLRELDVDGSGGVSFEEFQKSEFAKRLPEDKLRALFDRLDRDGDGQITAKDRPARPGGPDGEGKPERPGEPDHRPPGKNPRQMLRELDENGDGVVTFEEFRKDPRYAKLSEDEQEDRFEALDKNGDQKLDAADFPPPPDRPKKPVEEEVKGEE